MSYPSRFGILARKGRRDELGGVPHANFRNELLGTEIRAASTKALEPQKTRKRVRNRQAVARVRHLILGISGRRRTCHCQAAALLSGRLRRSKVFCRAMNGAQLIAFGHALIAKAHELILVGGPLGLSSVLAGLASRRIGAPILLVFLAFG